jgi:hypothetical protein
VPLCGISLISLKWLVPGVEFRFTRIAIGPVLASVLLFLLLSAYEEIGFRGYPLARLTLPCEREIPGDTDQRSSLRQTRVQMSSRIVIMAVPYHWPAFRLSPNMPTIARVKNRNAKKPAQNRAESQDCVAFASPRIRPIHSVADEGILWI